MPKWYEKYYDLIQKCKEQGEKNAKVHKNN